MGAAWERHAMCESGFILTVVNVNSLISLPSPYFIDCLANLSFRCLVSSLSATENCDRVVSAPSMYS